MKKLLLILISFGFWNLSAQETHGKITYERKVFWSNIYAKLPFLTQEQREKEIALWGKEQGKYAEKYELDFNSTHSLYSELPSENNGGWSWKGDEVMMYRDIENKTMVDKVNLTDKDFIIKGDVPRIKWKIHNELRDIQGYICMKATSIHPIHNSQITAWYTEKLPVSTGPEGLGGLPGIILMLTINDDDIVIEATSVTIEASPKTISLPKKMKGKEITFEKYKEDYNKFIKETLDGKRNPYWSVRL